MTGPAPRVAEVLNRGLHTLFAREERLYLIGEDLLDPYGGAFKISKGLSTKYPDRVLSTPLSEAGIVGVAGGLALCGNKVIAEMMFGDFIALGFDQLLNFASKSVSMYGRPVPMSLVVRCPVGGNRGYGPTHSQSPQKHFIGIPNLVLYELSPFHDPEALLDLALDRGLPGVLFEDKVLYTRRTFADNSIDDSLGYELVGDAPGWARVFDGRDTAADVVIIAPGGLAHRALEAAAELRADNGLALEILVPGQLYPLDLEPVLPLVRAAGRVAVIEEGTAGGTWGSEVASRLYERMWSELEHPVLRLSSADSIIPTAPHLERSVLLDAGTIHSAITGTAESPERTVEPAPESSAGTAITTPQLNNNDTCYEVVDWMRAEGDWVEAQEPVVALETSKAVEEIVAPEAGYLHQVVAVGAELAVGEILGHLRPDASRPPEHNGSPRPVAAPETHRLSRAQLGTAAVVTRSHRETPAAFTVVKVAVEHASHLLERVSDRTGATVGLVDLLVKAIASTHPGFPLMFGSIVDDQSVALADTPNVGVTVDTGDGLYVPVVDAADGRSLSDIADLLMEFRMKAVRGDFTAAELAGGNITLSVNPGPDVELVVPIVLWPQVCMVSLAGVRPECRLDDGGNVVQRRVVNLGLAYDHRVVNGRDAVSFLSELKALLEDDQRLSRLLSD